MMKYEEIKFPQPIIVFGPMRSGTSLTICLLHIGGAWCGKTAVGNWRNPLGFFENRLLLAAICKARRSGNNIIEAIQKEMISQGYCGGQWVVKLFQKQLKDWVDYDPYWVFTHRSFGSIYHSTHHDMQKKFTKEEYESIKEYWAKKIHGLVANWSNCREQIIQKTDKYFDITPQKIINGDHTELQNLYEKLGLVYYLQLVNHFIVPDHWHNKDEI